MFRCCHMFGCIPCMFEYPICLDAPIYLGAPCLDTPLYGQMPPHVWPPPCMFGCPPYVCLSPVCLDAPQIYGTSKGMRGIQTIWGVQTYGGHPSVWGAYGHMLRLTKRAFFCCIYTAGIQTSSKHAQGASKHMGVSKHNRRHPNIGVPKHTGVIQTLGHENIQGMHPNIWWCPNIWGHPNIGSAQI